MSDLPTVDALVDLLVATAEVPSEEGLSFSHLDHGLQCAYELRLAVPHDEELQVAGLVHDIGHRFGSEAVHGAVGARLLEPLLGSRVAALVEEHVPAKRYLITTEAGYRAQLSGDSIRTLDLQGGPFTDDEMAAWTRRPHWRDAVELRRADDRAKTPGRDVPGIEQWIPALRTLAARRERSDRPALEVADE